MGRRRNSTVDDMVEIVASLPWWAGVLMAIGSYLLMSVLAAMRGDPLVTVVAVFAGFLRFGLPVLFLLGAALSVWGRHHRRALFDSAARDDGCNAVAGMSWQQFELLIGEAYRRKGYVVKETGGGGADGGVDLVLTRDGNKTLVQCKHWRTYRVGVSVVRELYGVMAARGALAGCVITSGSFTQAAVGFAAGKGIELIDGPALKLLISTAAGQGVEIADDEAVPAVDSDAAPPACPACARPMVRRVAKQGGYAGEAFWGCVGFPTCRGVRRMR